MIGLKKIKFNRIVIEEKLKALLLKFAPYFYNKLRYLVRRPFERAFLAPEAQSDYLTVYCLGRIEDDCAEKLNDIASQLQQADICVGYLGSYQEEYVNQLVGKGVNVCCIDDELPVGVLPNSDRVSIIAKNSAQIILRNNIRVGIMQSNIELGVAAIRQQIKLLKRAGVDVIILYLIFDERNEEQRSQAEKLKVRVNQIVGIASDSSWHQSQGSEKIFDSVGTFVKKEYGQQDGRECIIFKHRFKKFGNKTVRLERSYIGCFFNPAIEQIQKIQLHNREHLQYRRTLGKNISGIVEEERALDVKKIFEILDMKIPHKYKSYVDMPVYKLCVYPFEITPKSVLFLREYDAIIHENTEEEYYRDKVRRMRAHARKGLVFVFSPIRLPKDIPHILCKSPLELHRILCRYILNLYDFDIKVAVTGSTGKTSAKEMIALTLSQKYNTFKNTGNENLQTKMGLLIQEFNPQYEAYVQEVGGGKIEGASNVSKMIEPDVGVVTNIGYAHLRWSKTREQLAINKIGIADGIRGNGPLFLNIDNDMLKLADTRDRHVITYAIENENVDYKAENIIESDNTIKFDILHNGISTPCVLNIPGKYNIYNALVSFGIGQYAGIDDLAICEAIKSYKPEGIRQTLMHIGGYNLFVDCFNASPDSMIGAVEALSTMGNDENKRIAVLADMTGLDVLTEELHKMVGEKISECDIDYLICYGNDIETLYNNYDNPNVKKSFVREKEEVKNLLRSIAEPGDYLLFKGSSKYKMESDIVDEMFGTNLSSLAFDRKKPKLYETRGVIYRIFPEYATAIGTYSEDSRIMGILDGVRGRKVISVAENAFAGNSSLRMIKLSRYTRNIQTNAFNGCKSLHSVVIPESLKIIDNNAFFGCSYLRNITLGNEIIHIGERAFYGCQRLQEIYLPDSVQFIGKEAFGDCDRLVVKCNPNSYAAHYATMNGICIQYT